MARYLLSVHSTESDHEWDLDDPALQRRVAKVDAFNAKVVDTGAWVFGGGLEAASSATVVRAHEGSTAITDGPYLESKEHIGGFWIVDVPDLDAALRLAEEASAACEEAVEVRPFQPEPEPEA
jgi:hypothetical protein